jgi:predicted nucleic-acid-binding protein
VIGLDTNVLVRYLVQDDAAQSKKAGQLIEKAALKGETLYLNLVVLTELTWMLESCYDLNRGQISDVMERILSTRDFEVEERDLTWQALKDFSRGPADFADCLIGHKNKAQGCPHTATFDQGLKKLDYFQVI